MSILAWLRRVRVDLFSSSGHWADVMAEADVLEADHDGRAQAAAEEGARLARGEVKSLLRDVESVLEGRDPDRFPADAEGDGLPGLRPPEPEPPAPSLH